MAATKIDYNQKNMKAARKASFDVYDSKKAAEFTMFREYSLALHAGAFKDVDFPAILATHRAEYIKAHADAGSVRDIPLLTKSRISERTGIIRAGQWACVGGYFDNLSKIMPTVTTLVDLSAWLEGRGWTKNKEYLALNLPALPAPRTKTDTAPPTIEELQKVIKAANAFHNRGKGESEPDTLHAILLSYAKRLETLNEKGRKLAKPAPIEAPNNPKLATIAAALKALGMELSPPKEQPRDENGNVVSIAERRKATAKRAAKKKAA